ncbi:MAG: uracil-DNA glycosylase [Methanoregulaceae archaeon]|jgi:DNA polymerase|nr:uracil-DNA glycosylase [Methanoregulaceae archaeon]
MVPDEPAGVILDRLSSQITKCRRCTLWDGAKQGVPGEGNMNARVMFIGEAPGEQEDSLGRPFVGRAGKVLDSLLAGIGLSREDVFIANIVKHRPPGNRDPDPDEITACTPWLEQQIATIRPPLLVPLGRHATRYLLRRIGVEFVKITDISGTVFEGEPFGFPQKIIPSLHPAATLHNPLSREHLKEDFRKLGDLISEMENDARI